MARVLVDVLGTPSAPKGIVTDGITEASGSRRRTSVLTPCYICGEETGYIVGVDRPQPSHPKCRERMESCRGNAYEWRSVPSLAEVKAHESRGGCWLLRDGATVDGVRAKVIRDGDGHETVVTNYNWNNGEFLELGGSEETGEWRPVLEDFWPCLWPGVEGRPLSVMIEAPPEPELSRGARMLDDDWK